MTDRLAELTAGTFVEEEEDLDEIEIRGADGDDDEIDKESEAALAKYRAEADALSKAIDKINENVKRIEKHYEVSLDHNRDQVDKEEASNNVSRILEQTEKTSDAVRKRLKRIAGENKTFSAENPSSTGLLRVRVNTHQGLTRRFMESMQCFEEAQEKHRSNVRNAMERQLMLINPGATEQELREALRGGTTDTLVEQSQTLAQLPIEEQARLRNGLSDLKSRNNDIKKLEASIIQLHQLFSDMQILVEAQGELLNDIEYNIDETKGKTKEGLEELVEARAHQKSANKKKICIIVIIICIILAILIPILVKYIPKWFPSTQDTFDNLPIVGNNTSVAFVLPSEARAMSPYFRGVVDAEVTALEVLSEPRKYI